MSSAPLNDTTIRACPSCGKQYRGADERSERCPIDGSTTILVQTERLLNQVVCEQYKLASLIGVGAWSEVYKAVDQQSGSFFAVKVLHNHLSADPLNVARFNREADLLLQLKHRCFATIYGRGTVDGARPCLVMEYLVGLSLDNYLSTVGRLTCKQALELFEPVCDALAGAHTKGLLHRDLKPSNIFLVEKDGVLLPKILDFGLAKMFQIGAGGALASLTQSGEILGTPSYMSPEQCQGNILDQRSDLYSLGCMMYETLTNQKAIPGKTAFEAMSNQIGRAPDPMHVACPDASIPEEVEALIFQLLSKDPADRFDDAKEFAAAFRSAVVADLESAGASTAKSTVQSASAFTSRSAASSTAGSSLFGPGSNPASSTVSNAGASSSPSLPSSTASAAMSASQKASLSSSSSSHASASSSFSSVSGRNPKLTVAAAQAMQPEKESIWKQLRSPLMLSLIGVGLLAACGLIWLLSGMIDSAYAPPPAVKEADNLTDVSRLPSSSTGRLLASDDGWLVNQIRARPNLTDLNISRKRFSPGALKALANAKQLNTLSLRQCPDVDNSTLAAIQGLNLVALDLSGTRVTGEGLRYLKGMNRLRKIDLSSTAVTDADCKEIAALPLYSLNIGSTGITGAGLKALSSCTTLGELFLDDTKFGDAIASLNPLPLTWLSVKDTEFADKDLRELLLPKLNQLTLDDTKITDAGLMAIVSRKEMKTVWVRECPNITIDGVQKAQAAATAQGRALQILTSGLGQSRASDRVKRTQDVVNSF
ncbi:MAG TPA: protein kinase [Oculatellaceae cyanobacterium]